MSATDDALPLWLFVSYGGGHVKALLPVAQRARDQGIARPLYLALTTAASAVRAAGLPLLQFSDVIADDDERARACGEKLAGQLEVQATDHRESVAYLGLSYADLEDRVGAVSAAQQYERYGRQALLPIGVLERIIREHEPALVVATNSPRAEQAAIVAARKLGVPSVCLVDLLGIWERERLAAPDYADAVCVLNDAVRESLLGAGRPARDVIVTGNPAFDSARDPSLKAMGERYRREAGWDGLHVCLYASSPEPQRIPGVNGIGDPDLPRRIERALIDIVHADERLALWVRRHPSEAPATDIAACGHPRVRVSGVDMPLHACIHGSDEVIVTVSTVGVEASLIGKPVTQVRGSILDHLSPYVAMGLAQRELDVEQLSSAFGPEARMRIESSQIATQGVADATGAVVKVLCAVQERFHGR